MRARVGVKINFILYGIFAVMGLSLLLAFIANYLGLYDFFRWAMIFLFFLVFLWFVVELFSTPSGRRTLRTK